MTRPRVWSGVLAVAVVVGAGAGVALQETRSAAASSGAHDDKVAQLTNRVRTLEREVSDLTRRLQGICSQGVLLTSATVDSSGQLRTSAVRCW
jgi:cell division protein FtsB